MDLTSLLVAPSVYVASLHPMMYLFPDPQGRKTNKTIQCKHSLILENCLTAQGTTVGFQEKAV